MAWLSEGANEVWSLSEYADAGTSESHNEFITLVIMYKEPRNQECKKDMEI